SPFAARAGRCRSRRAPPSRGSSRTARAGAGPARGSAGRSRSPPRSPPSAGRGSTGRRWRAPGRRPRARGAAASRATGRAARRGSGASTAQGPSRASSVPQMPFGRKRTKAMKIAPTTSGQDSVKTARRSSRTRNVAAPTKGPKKVQAQAGNVMMTTCPEAGVAAGPVGEVESDEVEELGERECQHREVDATPAQAEEADPRAARRREAEPRREPEPQRADLELRERDTGAIGAEPPVGGVA